MLEWSLANLAAWSVQAAALVVAGAWLPTKLRLGLPRSRLVLFRLLLVGCVGLPLLQPWHSVSTPSQAQPAAMAGPVLNLEALSAAAAAPAPQAAPPDVPLATRAREWAASVPWSTAALVVLLAGVATRLMWLALGLVSLARLRRSSTPIEPPTAPMDDAARAVGVTASFRQSPRVPRPVTFGLRSPVVIVPPGFTALEVKQQKAVACHELLHVRRQDWLRILGDELIRGLLWFHPGIWWLVEQIHLTAEQTIDREVVALVGDRRSYLRALLTLAESGAGPRLQPAACFLDHGHLRQRVAVLMEEASMSRVRLAASLVLVLSVLVAGGWYSVNAFPLRGAPSTLPAPALLAAASIGGGVATAPVATAQLPPAPPPPPPPPPPPGQAKQPGMPTAPTAVMPDEATLKRNIQLNPKDVSNYYVLAQIYEKAGDVAKAAATLEAAIKAAPADWRSYSLTATFYNRQGNFEKAIDALSRWSAADPQNPVSFYTTGSYYWEKAYRDSSLSDGQKRTYIDAGLQAVDRALAMNPEFVEAMVYKNLLLRSQTLLEVDADVQKALLAQADKLRDQAIAMRKAREEAGQPSQTYPPPKVQVGGAGYTAYAVYPPPPPPPPPAPPKVAAGAPVPPDAPPPPPPPIGADGRIAPLRVGGYIQPPTKIKDVKPVMPDLARSARVQGVVIVEATIGEDGRVRDVKVLRSIPLLDQAAIECVRQWEFSPTLLNGVPVPVIMTATVNFIVDQ
jgi:TonB family protein